MATKDFLNSNILGANAGIANRRGFREVGTAHLQRTEPNRRFFESIPTAWAEPYLFSKAIETGEQRATREWITLFLLHYFGVIYLKRFEKEVLQREYDRDLWIGLENTYPFSQSPLQRIEFLQTEDGAVVGASYPRVIFFPGRSRASWSGSADLQPYLEGQMLSWERAFQLHLGEAKERQRFHNFLRNIAANLLETSYRQTLETFCDDNFGPDYQVEERLSPDLHTWPTSTSETIDSEKLLQAYPLQRPNPQGGTDYFLVDDWPGDNQSIWMKSKTQVGIPPVKYKRGESKELIATFANRVYRGLLSDNDHVISLSSLLTPTAYCCHVVTGKDFSAYIRSLHEVQPSSMRTAEDKQTLSLAPLRMKFLEHFPETFNRLQHLRGKPLTHERIEWRIPIQDKNGNWLELRWVTLMMQAPEMPFTSLLLYPPKVSPDWKFYAMYGLGDKTTQGRWNLVDEQGHRGDSLELDFTTIGEPGSQYVSVLCALNERPNRPRAMAYKDGNDEEGGLFFFKDEQREANIRHTTNVVLAMDLGTSNSCLAIKSPAGNTEILKFSLTPLRLWGPPLQGELPGFVPLEWSGKKGFFTSILLSRKNDRNLPGLTPQSIQWEHWFKVDIPSLHQKIDEQVYRENRLDVEWNYHTNLKWSRGKNTPYRSLFLELALLYAHAEAFFEKGLKISRYVFTYPLAFSDEYEQGYKEALRSSLRRIRKHCYGEEFADQPENDNFDLLLIDESTAIAKSMRLHGAAGALELFIDVGGGTADIALRHNDEFLVLDSLRVAGRDFFRIAKRNFLEEQLANAKEFKRCMSEVLEDGKQEVPLSGLTPQLEGELGIYYSARLAGISMETFREKEYTVIKRLEAQDIARAPFFQKYRSMLFFEHILGYALVQACAAAVSHKLRLSNGLRLILAGNCWGLLMFAGYKRSRQQIIGEAKALLSLIKHQVKGSLSNKEQVYLDFDVKEVVLLGEEDLSKAKTSVARGAIEASAQDTQVADKAPYTGINIPQLQIGRAHKKVNWRWYDRWSKASLEEIFGRIKEIKTIEDAISPDLEAPFDPLLAVFTAIGKLEPPMEDTLPPSVWRDVNSEVLQQSIRKVQISGQRLTPAPLNYFLSEVLYPEDAPHDFLDDLARVNGHFKNGIDGEGGK